MNSAAIFHVVFWLSAFIFWLITTTAYHPSWVLRFLSTSVLVFFSAVFACRFTPSKLTINQVLLSVVALVASGIVAALLIHVAYDVLHGPDPLRFTLASNIVMDTTFIFVNTLVAFVLAGVVSYATGRATWRL